MLPVSQSDKIIRHRACTLRDTAYAYIKAEMDTDFEEKCRDIRDSRKERYKHHDKPSVPEFLQVVQDAVRMILCPHYKLSGTSFSETGVPGELYS